MKTNFYKIKPEKKNKIIRACIDEFGARGYEKSSIDRIIDKAGISKGGLYEYISKKEDIFLFTIQHTYRELYNYISSRVPEKGLENDFLDRFWQVSSIAINFYIDHPDYIKMISSSQKTQNQDLKKKIRTIFLDEFMKIFGNTDDSNLNYDKGKLLDLFTWLLVKTREDFLEATSQKTDVNELKKIYLENWKFYLSVFKTGIYKE